MLGHFVWPDQDTSCLKRLLSADNKKNVTEAFDLSRFVYSAYQYHFIWLTMGYLPVLMVIFYLN